MNNENLSSHLRIFYSFEWTCRRLTYNNSNNAHNVSMLKELHDSSAPYKPQPTHAHTHFFTLLEHVGSVVSPGFYPSLHHSRMPVLSRLEHNSNPRDRCNFSPVVYRQVHCAGSPCPKCNVSPSVSASLSARCS